VGGSRRSGGTRHANPFNGEPRRIFLAGNDHLIIADQRGQPFALNFDGSGQTALLSGRNLLAFADCGPKEIIFSEQQGDSVDVWKAEGDGSSPVQLTHVAKGERALAPACTPDGKQFIYSVTPNLYLQDIAGSAPPIKLEAGSGLGNARISPDGKTVVTLSFIPSETPGAAERLAFVFSPMGKGKPRYLFENVPSNVTWADWSPDGQAIDYAVPRRNAANIWRQPIAGGPYQQITKFNTPVLSGFRWSPDGKNLYVIRGTRSSDIVLLRDTTKHQ
jgi:Tol biopolymer transport system component